MRNALHEQLLKAGLVDEKRLEDVEREKRRERISAPINRPAKKNPRAQQNVAPPPPPVPARQQKTASEAPKNEPQAARRLLEREIVQMIKANRQRHNDGDEVYNFVDGQKIGRIYVTAAMHAQLTRGELAIVRLRTRYAVVSTATAAGIAEKAPEFLVTHQVIKPDSEDPAYAEHPVPDDLRW